MDNLIVFTGYTHEIPIVLGLFGKENLTYLSEFDAREFDKSHKQLYYHSKLNATICFYKDTPKFLNESIDFFKQSKRCVVFTEQTETEMFNNKLNEIANVTDLRKAFIWHYGELFERDIINKLSNTPHNLILSGANRHEMDLKPNYIFDALLPFRYFRYYIGYYYLEDLINNMPLPKYDKTKPKLFSYVRAKGSGSWRNDILAQNPKIGKMLNPKDSANDAYDLLYPKYKHFEAINDYLYCNYNIVFETLQYSNNAERFITEKTFKGLFFGKPILLMACSDTLNELKNKGFYLLNFDFVNDINTTKDVENSISLFSEWLDGASDEEIEQTYNKSLEKSIQNRHKLMEYLNDYSEMESIFTNLLN